MSAQPPSQHAAGATRRPTVVLLHDLELASRVWTPHHAALSAHYEVLAPDLPGFGASAGARRFVLDDAVASLAAQLASALPARGGGGGAAHVCGAGLGALVAVTLARRDPERLASVVLCDAPFGLPRAVHWAARLAATVGTDGQLAARAARRLAPAGPALAAAARDETARVGRGGLRAAWREIERGAPSPAELARVAVPTLLIAGAHGGAARRAARAIAAAVPGAELRTLPGAPAARCYLARPEAFTAALIDFVGAVEHRRGDDHDHIGCAMCN